MRVDVVLADETRKPVVRRLLELNAHDFSAFDGRDVGPDSEYGYPYLDLYWISSENRYPFLIMVDGQIGGCALVRAGDPNEFGEFFVLRKYRRSGVGGQAANAIFNRFAGHWDIHEVAGNDAAVAFWRRIIPVPFQEMSTPEGTHQYFTIRTEQ